jgi:hypothetical protein
MNLRCLNENFSIVKFQNLQNWFRETLTTFPKVNLLKFFLHLLAMCICDLSNSSIWGLVQGGGSTVSHFFL